MNTDQLSSAAAARYIAGRGDVSLQDIRAEEAAFLRRLIDAQNDAQMTQRASVQAAFDKAQPWILALGVLVFALVGYFVASGQ